MLRVVTGRLASALMVATGVVCLAFLITHVIPGDPVEVLLGEIAPAADREAPRRVPKDARLPELIAAGGGGARTAAGTAGPRVLEWGARRPALGPQEGCWPCHLDP